jgi:AI-2E family transporter
MAREPLFVLLVRIQIIEDDLEPGLGIGRNNLVHEGQELLAAPAFLVRARDLARRRTVALFVVVEPVVGHVIEPMVYGHSTGLSPVAVVASATFWTALWGPIGLVLATPLTVCLVVLGRHVESLEFLDIMFGDRPALSPPEIFYQRMLAGDPTEASEKAEEFLKERSLSSYYDEIALKDCSWLRPMRTRRARS